MTTGSYGKITDSGIVLNPIRGCDQGFVLHMAFVLMLLVSLVSGSVLYSAYHHGRSVRRRHISDQCLLDAQSALERIKYEIVQSSRAGSGSLAWFEDWDLNRIGSDPVYVIPELDPINESAVAVTIADVRVVAEAGYAEIELIGAASRQSPFSVRRMISETLRIVPGGGDDGSQVFDYAYFVNSNGLLEGAQRVINGGVRANGNFTFRNNPEINGNLYASGLIIGGTRHWPQGTYWTRTMAAARPTDPTDAAGNHEWPMGYDAENVTRNERELVLPMPKIGDITDLAAGMNGTIAQDGTNIVVGFYDGPGPDGIAGTADDGTLVLIGVSAARPVRVNGSVLVKGDLIIRGHVAGQGTIYAGRNIHIVGGISYLNPPAWPKVRDQGDSNPHLTAAANATKDLLVLAARGNIVVGNYTTAAWSNRVWDIMADPSGINPRAVSKYDAEIGYDSDNNPGNGYWFDGRYYVEEAHGGRRLSGDGTSTAPRRYYESSLANSTFNALCSTHVSAINAALFSNHGIIGDIGSSAPSGDTIINGAMVCHDDMHNYYGAFTLNWDIRLGSQSKERNINFLPGPGQAEGKAKSVTIRWKEIY